MQGNNAGEYDGLDRFGRMRKVQWRDYGASASAAYIVHTYDYAGNRTSRTDLVGSESSEAYQPVEIVLEVNFKQEYDVAIA